MRVVNFPAANRSTPASERSAELEAALNGDGQGPAAESWRELRADVRALAPPLDPGLERRLREEIERRTAPRARSLPAWLPRASRPRLARALVAAAVAVLAAALIGGVALHSGSTTPLTSRINQLGPSGPVTSGAGSGTHRAASPVGAQAPSVQGPLQRSGSVPEASASSAAVSAPAGAEDAGRASRRVQQLGASLSLSTAPAEVQAISDGVARVTTREGGYVASSHVQVQQHGGSEASLSLRLPSAHLGAALASIGRLAAVSSESQSLQDITGSYDSARQQLADANAERQALLRALAKASSEGQIDSLRERLAQTRAAIAVDQARVHAVSQRASNAEVEVTVLGSTHAANGRLSVSRGLHDAGRILTVALAVLVIAAAVLLPLALLFAALALATGRWRRYARERVLADS